MEELVNLLDANFGYTEEIPAKELAEKILTYGYERIVRCRNCIHGHFKHQDMYECLHDADIDEETGVAYGFIEYHDPEFFCGYGEKRKEK